MRLVSRIGRRGRAVLLVLVGAAAGGAAYVAADVPDSTGVIHACYQLSDPDNPPNPSPGNLHIIDPSAGQTCQPGGADIALDWNFTGAPGARGAQGPAGNTFTVATPTVKTTFSPIAHVVLGTGANALSFNVLATELNPTIAKSGKVSFHEFTIKKTQDKASAKLFDASTTGKHFSTATITLARKAGGDPQSAGKPFLKMIFETVFVSKIQTSSGGGGGGKPAEQVTLNFSKIKVEYKEQSPGRTG